MTQRSNKRENNEFCRQAESSDCSIFQLSKIGAENAAIAADKASIQSNWAIRQSLHTQAVVPDDK